MAEGIKSNPPSELLPVEQANPATPTAVASTDKPSAAGEQGEADGVVEQSKKGGKLARM